MKALTGVFVIPALLCASVAADELTLNAQPGVGSGTISWVAGGATSGDDLMSIGGTASTYVGKHKNKRLFVPVADSTLDSTDAIYAVTVRVRARSDVDLRGTYDGLTVAASLSSVDYLDPAIDEIAMTYGMYEHTWNVSPATGVAWTWAEVNALEAGVVTAKSARPTDMVLYCDYLEVVVDHSPDNTPPTASDVTASGTPTVGDTVSGAYAYADAESDPEGASVYRWYRSDDVMGTNRVALSACTTATCVLPVSTQGLYVTFEVTPVATMGVLRGTAVESAPMGPVAAATGSAPLAGDVVLSGIDTVGGTLYASYAYSDADGDLEGASEYQWVKDGVRLDGVSGLSYTLTADDEGSLIQFEVTPVASTGTPAVGDPVGSAAIGPIAAATGSAPEAQSVSISGTTAVGDTLAGSYAYNDADGDLEGTTTFRWLRDGVAIAGATDDTYVLTIDDDGAMIVFEVTASAVTGTPSQGAPTASDAVGPIGQIVAVTPAALPAQTSRQSTAVFFDLRGRQVRGTLPTGHVTRSPGILVTPATNSTTLQFMGR